MALLRTSWSGRKKYRRLSSVSQWTWWKVGVAFTIKNYNGSDTVLLGMCNPIFAICLQDLKKH
eukprot:803467-Ditylum_brightwellii.AAC.1